MRGTHGSGVPGATDSSSSTAWGAAATTPASTCINMIMLPVTDVVAGTYRAGWSWHGHRPAIEGGISYPSGVRFRSCGRRRCPSAAGAPYIGVHDGCHAPKAAAPAAQCHGPAVGAVCTAARGAVCCVAIRGGGGTSCCHFRGKAAAALPCASGAASVCAGHDCACSSCCNGHKEASHISSSSACPKPAWEQSPRPSSRYMPQPDMDCAQPRKCNTYAAPCACAPLPLLRWDHGPCPPACHLTHHGFDPRAPACRTPQWHLFTNALIPLYIILSAVKDPRQPIMQLTDNGYATRYCSPQG